MAAKFVTGLPLDGPDPECVLGAVVGVGGAGGAVAVTRAAADLSKPVTFLRRPLTGVTARTARDVRM